MQAYIVSCDNLAVRCVCVPTAYELNEDSLSAAVSSVKFSRTPTASTGDFVVLKDRGATRFVGVVSSVEGDKSTTAAELRMLPISSVFSRNILLGEPTATIEQFVKAAIDANFVASGDELLDRSYIVATAQTATETDVTPHNDKGIHRLKASAFRLSRRVKRCMFGSSSRSTSTKRTPQRSFCRERSRS